VPVQLEKCRIATQPWAEPREGISMARHTRTGDKRRKECWVIVVTGVCFMGI